MKKAIFFLNLILLISCARDNDDKVVTNQLKKRVVLLESYDSNKGTTFVSDSVIETYENKMIVRKDHYFKTQSDSPYISRFDSYEYNANNYLIKSNSYNDINLNENYATTNYQYNEDGNIKNIVYNRFNPSNFSTTLSNTTTHFEYVFDTINRYVIDHMNNDNIIKSDKYIVYGNLESISENNNWIHRFDSLNDRNETNCLGNDCNTYYNKLYVYENIRNPLIKNIFGNDLNNFIIRTSFEYYYLETARKRLTKILSIYPTLEKNGEVVEFNYIFDNNNRLIEIYTTGSYLTKDIIKYYYE